MTHCIIIAIIGYPFQQSIQQGGTILITKKKKKIQIARYMTIIKFLLRTKKECIQRKSENFAKRSNLGNKNIMVVIEQN